MNGLIESFIIVLRFSPELQPPAFIFHALSTRLIFLSQIISINFKKPYYSLSFSSNRDVPCVDLFSLCNLLPFQHPHVDLTMGSYKFCARQVQSSSSSFTVLNCKHVCSWIALPVWPFLTRLRYSYAQLLLELILLGIKYIKYLFFPLLEKTDDITLHYKTKFHGISEQHRGN